MNNLSKSLWGVLLITIGIILGLNALAITNINLFFDGWWTLFIIIPSFINLFNEKEDKIGNLIGLSIGIALLLASQNIIRFDLILKLAFPFILIMIGLSFIFSNNIKKKVNDKIKTINKNDLENIVAVFSNQNIIKDSKNFKGANLDAVFGGITLDLKNAQLDNETIIKVSSIFSGIDILLPEELNIELKATPIFGSVSNKIKNNNDNKKTIYIDAFCLFGGVDLK